METEILKNDKSKYMPGLIEEHNNYEYEINNEYIVYLKHPGNFIVVKYKKNNKLVDKCIQYDFIGKITNKTDFIDGKFTECYDDPTIISITRYMNYKLDGKQISYWLYPNYPRWIEYYKNNKLHGESVSYEELSNKIWYYANYINGKKEGKEYLYVPHKNWIPRINYFRNNTIVKQIEINERAVIKYYINDHTVIEKVIFINHGDLYIMYPRQITIVYSINNKKYGLDQQMINSIRSLQQKFRNKKCNLIKNELLKNIPKLLLQSDIIIEYMHDRKKIEFVYDGKK